MPIKALFIDRDIVHLPQVQAIRNHLGNVPANTIQGLQEVFDTVLEARDPVQKGKEVLVLTRNRGEFVRKCPGTRCYTCCGYMILHIGTFCSMDCSYCILQSYFHPPVLQYFVNHDDMLQELEYAFEEKAFRRIGTGEFTDSMIWEQWTGLSDVLVPKFAGQQHMVLELKTKTVAVKNLQTLDHQRKTIVSWSLNTERIISSEERRTAPLDARLEAAARCEAWGYPLAFHFDPMVLYEGCEAEYRQVVRRLFDHVDPDNIVWISLGTFRFMPSLKTIVAQRFAHSKIPYGEFITGLDGKMRYFKPLRIALYQKMAAWIKEIAPDVLVYFCMEDEAVWQQTFGFVPEEKGGLPRMLDDSAIRHCGLV